MAIATANVPINMSTMHSWEPTSVPTHSSTKVVMTNATTGDRLEWIGTGFTFDAELMVAGGTLNSIVGKKSGVLQYSVTGLSDNGVAVQDFWMADNIQGMFGLLFDGADTMNGSSGADAINGYGGGDLLKGNGGNDVLNGGSGADRMYGAGGNDTLYWAGNEGKADGGDGSADKLKIASGSLDLRLVDDTKILGTEIIDMNGGGANNLIVRESDVLALSSTTNTLKVLGTSVDTLDLRGTFTDLGVVGSFHQYKSGSAIVYVETDVTVL